MEIWDVTTGTTLTRTRHHGDFVNDVLFQPGDRVVLIPASDDMTVARWGCEPCEDPEAALEEAKTTAGPR